LDKNVVATGTTTKNENPETKNVAPSKKFVSSGGGPIQ